MGEESRSSRPGNRGATDHPVHRPSSYLGPLLAALLAALFAALPFIAAGQVGILGVGLVNDDMASHLLLADWLREGFRPEPVLVDQGYPLGPHALVAGIGELIGADSVDVFAGLVLAIPALTALVAHSLLDGLRPVARVGAAALTALPYMAAAYLAQEAFKEPLIALFLLAFALLLAAARDWRDAIALGVLGAGTVYVYSFPGLAWLAGMALVWGALVLVRDRRLGRWWPGLLAAAVVLAVLVVPDLERLRDFADFRALDPDRANEGGLGNLPGQLSPLEALGIWPTSEFRLSASAADLPAAIFYAGGLFAFVCLCLALPRWLRRHGPAIPAALVTAAVLYLIARALGTVYTSAKALAIAAPLIALIVLGGLLARDRGRTGTAPLAVVGIAFALAAAASSFLILRQAPVGPTAHAEELAEIRPLVEGEKLLFLGRDNFVLHELRGSKPFTHVRNFYDPYFVEPNFELADVGAKFDFDSVTAETLARFDFVLTTRAAYASGPPPGYEPVAETASYVLWERGGATPAGREPGETDAAPGRVGGCEREPRELASFAREPVLAAEMDVERADARGWRDLDDRARARARKLGALAALRLDPAVDDRRAGARGGAPREPRLPGDGAVLGGGNDPDHRQWPGADHRDGRRSATRRPPARRRLGRPPGRRSRRPPPAATAPEEVATTTSTGTGAESVLVVAALEPAHQRSEEIVAGHDRVDLARGRRSGSRAPGGAERARPAGCRSTRPRPRRGRWSGTCGSVRTSSPGGGRSPRRSSA